MKGYGRARTTREYGVHHVDTVLAAQHERTFQERLADKLSNVLQMDSGSPKGMYFIGLRKVLRR